MQKNLARTLRTLARGGRDAFYRGEIARAIVDYCQKNGGFLSMEDFAAQKSDWVEPISTTYRGHTLYELPPNSQGLTALLLLNILEGIDLTSMRTRPGRYYHTLIEATKIAFADRNRYIADPGVREGAGEGAAVEGLRRQPARAHRSEEGDRPAGVRRHPHGQRHDLLHRRRQGSQRRVVHQQHLQLVRIGRSSPATPASCCTIAAPASRSSPGHPNRLEPGKRPFHTLIPAMVFKDGKLLMSYGVMGGDIQAQGHVQVLVNLIDRGLNLQQAIDAPRVRYISGRGVMMEDELTAPVIDAIWSQRGHERVLPPAGLTHRALMGGGQAIMIDPATGALLGRVGFAQGWDGAGLLTLASLVGSGSRVQGFRVRVQLFTRSVQRSLTATSDSNACHWARYSPSGRRARTGVQRRRTRSSLGA